ncbi:MAG TPA: methionine synthase [Dehalococcoidia bacterium]|nr:methionine synthase [Dehalococcoidia bacterium]
MPDMNFGCLPTIIGSMPQEDAASACNQIAHYLKDIPAWPQLPERSFLENMYVQYSEGFPGVVVENNKIYVDKTKSEGKELENLYSAYIENDFKQYAISPEYAAGLHYFLGMDSLSPKAVKGQVTGPVSWGLTVTDENRKSVIYDDVLGDAAARLLRLKAAWMENVLKKLSKNTIIFLDEPYMVSFGSAFFSVSREKVVKLMEEVLGGISGLKGVHCCGNTDWSVLLETSIDILNFDTYNYSESLTLYPAEVKKFIDRGGVIAWGIVANDEEPLAGETVSSLKDRLEEAMAPFTRNGIKFDQLVKQSLLTPSCSLASMSIDAAGRALELLAELSDNMRRRYL